MVNANPVVHWQDTVNLLLCDDHVTGSFGQLFVVPQQGPKFSFFKYKQFYLVVNLRDSSYIANPT